MASIAPTGTGMSSGARSVRIGRIFRTAGLLLTVAGRLLAQDGNWSYHSATDMLSDMRNDEVWTDAVVPASPAYKLGVACEDTEYVSVLVRSDAVISSAARLSVRFDGGAAEVLPIQYSLATAKRFDFEPGGPALRRILASKRMAFSLQNGDLQEISVQFDVAGLEAAMKQMPLKCQQRFAQLVEAEKPVSKAAARPRPSS
jgi:hypothetical protein